MQRSAAMAASLNESAAGWRQWPRWAPYAAATWSLAYAALGLWWWTGGGGFPYGSAADPSAAITLLGWTDAGSASPVIVAWGLAATAVAAAMARAWGTGAVRAALIGFGLVTAITLALLIPDYRVLVVVAYAPIVLIGAPFGFPPDTDLLAVITVPVINQFACIIGGLLWAAATLSYWRRGRGACLYCGRGLDARADADAWTAPHRAARWGRWATYLAVAVPLLYAATRWAWALGIPLGISEDFLREGQAVGLWLFGAALATVAVIGAVLTLGLTQSWGERLPRWLPWLGGRGIPTSLVVVPASLIAVVVTSAGIMFWRLTLGGGLELGTGRVLNPENAWAAVLPELIWPVWGVALGAAAYAYHLKRRGRCGACGQGDARPGPDDPAG